MNLRKALAEKHAMQVLLRLVDTYPELANELRALIESELPRATPGFRSRGEKVLRALARIDLGKEGARTKKKAAPKIDTAGKGYNIRILILIDHKGAPPM